VKRKNGHREPNGQLQRAGRPAVRADIRAVALAQPHRRGNADQLCADAVGRLCIASGLRPEIYAAADAYRAQVRAFYRLIQLTGYTCQSMPLTGLTSRGKRRQAFSKPLDLEAFRRAVTWLDATEKHLLAVSRPGFFALRGALNNGGPVPPAAAAAVAAVLCRLAVETGFLPAYAHPFTGAMR
jgi:hypothetical protein